MLSKFMRSVLICYPNSNLGFTHIAKLFKTTVSSQRHTNEKPHSKCVRTNCTSFWTTSPGFYKKKLRIDSLPLKASSGSFLCKRFVETKQTKQHALGVLLSCWHIHQSKNNTSFKQNSLEVQKSNYLSAIYEWGKN